ncbi:MAG: cyclic nucleotide-binding and patatin-like phospholipase domain-containing protein [Minicystis sp.]
MIYDYDPPSSAAQPRLFGYEDDRVFHAILRSSSRVLLDRGEHLFRAGTAGDGCAIVLSGRLVATGTDATGRRWTSKPVTTGGILGELALLTGAPRSADVVALRPSEVLWLAREDFELICRQHPEFLLHVSRTIAERLGRPVAPPEERRGRVIALVGLDHEEGLRWPREALAARLARFGRTALVDPAVVEREIGVTGVAGIRRGDRGDRRTEAWLMKREAEARFVILDAGTRPSPWLARCLEHADQVLIFADARSAPELRPVEENLYSAEATAAAPVSLALVHPKETVLPKGTARWLDVRKLHAHHHLRAGSAEHMDRLARSLAGKSVSLVLGGGGALGAAHVGVLDALHARGLPCDAVGGTSAGGGIGAQIAMGWGPDDLRRINLRAWVEQAPFKKPTIPLMSLVSRSAIDAVAREMFGDAQIEDLWTPFFCVSTDLTRGAARVHRRGPVWLAARATGAVPAILPPVIDDGVLVDGGVVDNLPVGTMRDLSGGVIVAVDLAPQTGLEVDGAYDDLPTPARAIWSRLTSGSRPRLPTLGRVLVRALMVSSQREREKSRAAADVLLEPPLRGFNPTRFDAFDQIREVARTYAAEKLAGVDLDGLLRLRD